MRGDIIKKQNRHVSIMGFNLISINDLIINKKGFFRARARARAGSRFFYFN